MRLIFVAGILAALASAATFACSSASPATASTGDAGAKSSSGSTTTSSGSTTTSTSSSSGDTTTTPGDDDDAGDSDADTTITPSNDGGLSQNSDAGSLCDTDAYGELEPNDTPPASNDLPVSGLGSFKFCGSVVSGNNDWVTFTMPANVHGYGIPSIKATGQLDVSGTIGGQAFDATQGSFPNNRQAGDIWLVKITTTSTNALSYQLTFQFQ